MRITLNEKEILIAIEDFILREVRVPEDNRIDIDLKATRGDEGYTAEIDILQISEPEGSRAVDDRIEATDEARAEGLDIVGKIDAARAEAKAPRRRGRPAGSKNLPKDPAPEVTTGTSDTATETSAPAVTETVAETAQPVEEAQAVEAVQAETKDTPEVAPEPSVTDPAPEPEAVSEKAPAPVEDSTANKPVQAAEVQASDVSTQAKRSSLFDNVSDAGDPAPEPEANTEAALAAEAKATEPSDEEIDIPRTPETPGFESSDVPKTRSLFGDLAKPTN